MATLFKSNKISGHTSECGSTQSSVIAATVWTLLSPLAGTWLPLVTLWLILYCPALNLPAGPTHPHPVYPRRALGSSKFPPARLHPAPSCPHPPGWHLKDPVPKPLSSSFCSCSPQIDYSAPPPTCGAQPRTAPLLTTGRASRGGSLAFSLLACFFVTFGIDRALGKEKSWLSGS